MMDGWSDFVVVVVYLCHLVLRIFHHLLPQSHRIYSSSIGADEKVWVVGRGLAGTTGATSVPNSSYKSV